LGTIQHGVGGIYCTVLGALGISVFYVVADMCSPRMWVLGLLIEFTSMIIVSVLAWWDFSVLSASRCAMAGREGRS